MKKIVLLKLLFWDNFVILYSGSGRGPIGCDYLPSHRKSTQGKEEIVGKLLSHRHLQLLNIFLRVNLKWFNRLAKYSLVKCSVRFDLAVGQRFFILFSITVMGKTKKRKANILYSEKGSKQL